MALPDMNPVFSSNVDAVGYDDGTLFVRWKSGKVSSYKGVPADVAQKAANAWSVGTFVREEIIGSYAHEYVSGE